MKKSLSRLSTSLYITFIFLVLLLFQTASARGTEQEVPLTLPDLKQNISNIMTKHNVPGASIVLVDESGPIMLEGIGNADLENNIPVDTDTLFRAGSTSKLFVGLSILKLMEAGKLTLNDEIKDLIPEIEYINQWHNTDPIRIVHLLEHTSGWGDIHFPEYAYSDPKPFTLKQGLAFHPDSRVSRWKPGSRMSYSNAGPAVAAYIVEKTSGLSYEDYVQETFFTPLQMHSSTFLLNQNIKDKGAITYSNGVTPLPYKHLSLRPSGALTTSANDISKLLMFFVNRGYVDNQVVLSENSLSRMETAKSSNAAQKGQELGYGLTNYLKPYKHWLYRQHNGALPGSLTNFSYLVKEKLGYAILINSDNYAAMREISTAIMDYQTHNLPKVEIKKEMDVQDIHRTIEGLYFKINSRNSMFDFMNIFQLRRLYFDCDKLVEENFFGDKKRYYYPISDHNYKSVESGVSALSQVIDPLAGEVVHIDKSVLKSISPNIIYLILLIALTWLMIIVFCALYGIYWSLRLLSRKGIKHQDNLIRLLPILSSISIICFVVLYLFFIGMEDLGSPSFKSISIMLLTSAYGLFSLLGAVWLLNIYLINKDIVINKFFTFCCIIHFIVASYLFYHGVIGLRLWQ